MTVIHNSNAKILFYGPSRETCLGLTIPGEMREIPVSSMDIDISYGSNIDLEQLGGIKDASGSFTGYFEKDGCDHGADSPGTSGS